MVEEKEKKDTAAGKSEKSVPTELKKETKAETVPSQSHKPAGRGKRYQASKKKIDPEEVYTIDQAVSLVKETGKVKFDAAVELHLRLGVDPAKSDQAVKGTVSLPHATGQKKRIAVFASGTQAKEAKDAGADIVGGEELIAEIKKTKKADLDIAVATPEMMPKIGPIARILGPKGLMPSPKTETITSDPARTVKELTQGKVDFRMDATANLHQILGRVSYEDKKLIENFRAFVEAVKKSRPEALKGELVKKAYLTSTMGPSVKVKI